MGKFARPRTLFSSRDPSNGVLQWGARVGRKSEQSTGGMGFTAKKQGWETAEHQA